MRERGQRRANMASKPQKIGWIGMGRMGFPMAERLAQKGGKVVEALAELTGVDVLFSIVSTGKDLDEVYFGKHGLASRGDGRLPRVVVDCSTIAVEESAAIRERLKALGSDFVAAPVSGNAKVIKAGRLSAVVSGP